MDWTCWLQLPGGLGTRDRFHNDGGSKPTIASRLGTHAAAGSPCDHNATHAIAVRSPAEECRRYTARDPARSCDARRRVEGLPSSRRRAEVLPPSTRRLVLVHSGSHAASRPGARSPTKASRCCACSPAQITRSASAFGLHRRRPRAPEFMPKRNSGRSTMTAGALTTRRFSRLAKPRDAPAVVSRRRLPSHEREARQRVAAMLPHFVLPKHNALVSVTSAGSVAGRRAAGTRERIASR